jgi:hypothetical protein
LLEATWRIRTTLESGEAYARPRAKEKIRRLSFTYGLRG